MLDVHFAALLPQRRLSKIQEAVERLAWEAELVTYVSNVERTYATVKLLGRLPRGGDEYAIFLVSPDDISFDLVGPARLIHGAYGYADREAAIRAMYARARH